MPDAAVGVFATARDGDRRGRDRVIECQFALSVSLAGAAVAVSGGQPGGAGATGEWV